MIRVGKSTMATTALGVALALVLVACGGDDAADGERAAPATTASSAPAASSATSAVPASTAAPSTTAATVAAAASSQTTEAPAAPASGPSWEQIKDASIPGLCNHPPAQLVDGKDVSLGPNDGVFTLLRTFGDGTSALVSDLRAADGKPLTAVVAACNAGGVSWPHHLLFFSGSGTYETSTMLDDFDWASIGLAAPGRDGIGSLRADGDRLEVVLRAERPSDASCCPSASARAHVTVADGRATVTDADVIGQP
jgi:hypothetical protein